MSTEDDARFLREIRIKPIAETETEVFINGERLPGVIGARLEFAASTPPRIVRSGRHWWFGCVTAPLQKRLPDARP